jgi:hypothetical protein
MPNRRGEHFYFIGDGDGSGDTKNIISIPTSSLRYKMPGWQQIDIVSA